MATVVDRLVVELGLDPKAFTKGQREAAAALLKTRQEAEKESQKIEKAIDSATAAVDRLARNALKLFAIFTAGRAIKDFVSDVTGADAALGRLATRIGQAPSDISAMASAVNRAGGSFDAAANSFQAFSDNIQQIRITGDSSILPFLARVQAAGGKTINLNKDISETFIDLADNLKVIRDRSGDAQANYLGRQLGLDEGTVALLVRGGAAVRAYLEQSRRLGVATKADTEAAQNLQTTWRGLTQASEGLGRTILTALTPTIVDLLKRMQEWIEKNGEWLRTNIVEAVRKFADVLKGIDWAAIAAGVKAFVEGANWAAQAVGGWSNAVQILFGLWLGSKFIRVLANIALIRAALLGGRGGLLAGGLGGLFGALAIGSAVAADRSLGATEKKDLTNHNDDQASGAAPGGMWGAVGRAWNWGKRKLGFGGGSDGGAGAPAGSGTPSGSAAGSLTSLIDEEARKAGIDPRIMHGIRAGESLKGDRYDVKSDAVEDSYGPFQLNRRGGLGAEFERETGLDARDPKTIADQTRWVARYIAKQRARDPNWNPGTKWFGYRGDREADPRWGNSGYAPSGSSTQTAGDVPGSNGVGAVEQRQQNGTRSQPITEALRNQLAAAARNAGVNAEIFSGGQDSHGSNRVGTHRHDHGRSADLKLYQIGPDGKRRYLRHDNDADRVIMENFLRESVKAGANGIGAGPGYMGPDRMHVGGGSEAAWGAGGSSANAPDWVTRAHREGLAARRRSSAHWWRGSPNAMAHADQARQAQAAQMARISNDNRSSSSTTNSTRIGSVTVQTAATDADGIARDMEDALKRRSLAAAANYGQA